MTLRPRFRLHARLATPLLVALMYWAVPERAAAGCGDYLVILNDRGESARHPHPPPCHGPNCALQDGPVAPLSPTAPVSAPTPHDAILSPAGPADSPVSRAIDWPSTHVLNGHPLAIFHPPRSA